MRKPVTVAVVSAVVGALVAVPVAVFASHSFTDVPGSNTFHEDIAWLEEAGVTKGCNPPANTEFCPKDEVTREQMAAFMHRLADNQVVDAGALQGFAAHDLASRAAFDERELFVDWDPGPITAVTVTLVAPARGVVIIEGEIPLFANTTTKGSCWIWDDDHTNFGHSSLFAIDPTVNPYESCRASAAAVVDAGEYELTLWGECLEPDCPRVDRPKLWAIWVPFDGNGQTP